MEADIAPVPVAGGSMPRIGRQLSCLSSTRRSSVRPPFRSSSTAAVPIRFDQFDMLTFRVLFQKPTTDLKREGRRMLTSECRYGVPVYYESSLFSQKQRSSLEVLFKLERGDSKDPQNNMLIRVFVGLCESRPFSSREEWSFLFTVVSYSREQLSSFPQSSIPIHIYSLSPLYTFLKNYSPNSPIKSVILPLFMILFKILLHVSGRFLEIKTFIFGQI